nr:hypothetical protein [Curtobacterium sp. VKM Ac-2865]
MARGDDGQARSEGFRDHQAERVLHRRKDERVCLSEERREIRVGDSFSISHVDREIPDEFGGDQRTHEIENEVTSPARLHEERDSLAIADLADVEQTARSRLALGTRGLESIDVDAIRNVEELSWINSRVDELPSNGLRWDEHDLCEIEFTSDPVRQRDGNQLTSRTLTEHGQSFVPSIRMSVDLVEDAVRVTTCEEACPRRPWHAQENVPYAVLPPPASHSTIERLSHRAHRVSSPTRCEPDPSQQAQALQHRTDF